MSLIDRITNYIKIKSLSLSLTYDNHFYGDDYHGWAGNILNIYYAVKEGEDISPAISALMKVDSTHPNKALAGKAIVHHYLNTSDWKNLNEFLEKGPKHLLLGAMEVLGEDCENGLDVSNLIPANIIKKLINHDYVNIRKNSSKMVSAMKNPHFNELLELLDARLETKQTALYTILELAEKGADVSLFVPKLLELLHNKQSRVRSDAAMCIGEIGNPEYIPNLMVLLKDEAPEVRYFAAKALADIAQKTCEKEDNVSALKRIKTITSAIMGMKGKNGLIHRDRRFLLNDYLASMTKKIKGNMDKDKKTFPVKHQQVRTVRRQVVANG